MIAQPDPNNPGEAMAHYPKENATVVLPPDKQTFVFNFYAGGRVTLCYVFYSNHTVLGVGKATRHPKDTHDWQTAKRIAAKRACEAMSEIAGENKEQRRHYNQELYSAFRNHLREREYEKKLADELLKHIESEMSVAFLKGFTTTDKPKEEDRYKFHIHTLDPRLFLSPRTDEELKAAIENLNKPPWPMFTIKDPGAVVDTYAGLPIIVNDNLPDGTIVLIAGHRYKTTPGPKPEPPQMQKGPFDYGHRDDAMRYIQARLDKDDRILKHLNPEYFNLHFKPEWATNPNIKMDEYSKIDEKRRATEKALEELYQMKWDPTPADMQPNQIGYLFKLMRQKESVIADLQLRLEEAKRMIASRQSYLAEASTTIKELREFNVKATAQVKESTENVARSNRLLAEASKQLDDMTKVIEYYKTMDQVNKERIEALENELANYGTDDE